MLKAEGIIKKYQIPGRKKDLLEALSGVSIELADNSITAIVGESGSGKSTLARILSYIELPDAGKVTLDNLTVTGVKRKTLQKMRGKVQLVMQDAASSLDPHQNVLQILDEPLHLLLDMGKEDRKKRVEELLDMVNLGGDILNRRPDELSGGQQKRLCVARALATEPQHIIFDESFSGLDVTLRKQILHLLRNLRDELRLSYLIINTKWEATKKAPYKSLSVPYRYKLQHHLSYAYGRKFAKTIMRYVYDYLRQDCDIYAWWEWGKYTQIFAQNSRRFFRLSIRPVQRK